MFEKLLASAGQVLFFGLLIGAGLPTLFAVGIKAMAYGVGGDAEISHEQGHLVGKLVGYLCFAVVLGAIALGITIVVASGLNKAVSFEHIVPIIVPKS
jgi:hypothetical protein